MKNGTYHTVVLALLLLVAAVVNPVESDAGGRRKGDLRLLYWNIQNGMWSGQADNYERFVEWVSAVDPDVCVWCEAQSIYRTGTAERMDAADRYLVDHWPELAARYGHKYCYVGGHRDNYPQVITSKYPIENVKRIVGVEPDSVVTHGAGWARIVRKGRTINIVTLHLWPQSYAYRAKDQKASGVAREGDDYRRMEIEHICNHTIATHAAAADELWMMMGDFNAWSRLDNWIYGYAEDDSRFRACDYVMEHTPYEDVIGRRHRGKFCPTLHTTKRIDFVFCTPMLYDCIVNAEVLVDDYTDPVRDPKRLSNFWHPSDHRPILVDFDLTAEAKHGNNKVQK